MNLCAGCFWLAQELPENGQQWCAHQNFHGYIEGKQRCIDGFRLREPPLQLDIESERKSAQTL